MDATTALTLANEHLADLRHEAARRALAARATDPRGRGPQSPAGRLRRRLARRPLGRATAGA